LGGWRSTRHRSACTAPVNFHSWRYAFNSAPARRGVNMQKSMSLVGHSDAKTHMRYVTSAAEMKVVPVAALPQFKPENLFLEPLAVANDFGENHDTAKNKYAPLAQLDRATASGAVGQRFESSVAR
jgi:hypothetical protein